MSGDVGTPAGGWGRAEILQRLQALRAHDLPAHGGRTLAYVYDSGLAQADAIGLEALQLFAASNGLDPTAFPSLLRMENDLVAWAGRLLDAPDGFVGSATSGGTESLLLAVLAARDARPDIARPSMVLPTTAHAAFHKAAHYFGVRPVLVDVDPVTYRADPAAMAAAIDDTTVLVVASAPSYAHGVIDPVPQIAAAAAERGVRCHVDACIGGWVLPYLDHVEPWTFAVPGVTSMSVDLHKYAYTPKGVSLLLHRDAALRRTQLFASASWPGYTMLNSTVQSTKSGGPLAAAWAVVHHIGDEGYRRLVGAARRATLELADAVAQIPALSVVVPPDATLLTLVTDGSCDVFTLADEMLTRGWFVQPQMTFRDMPATLHLTLSAATAPSVPEFVDALRASVASAQDAGPVRVPAQLADAVATLDPASLDESAFAGLLRMAGLADEDGDLALPDRMAAVNAVLDAAPAPVREALLLGVLDRLSRPS
ncbi:aminotransferase class V-fold PLP-dependent enzyme [Isoptericola sp. b490]|uniref:pyridoxal phosphate-dependent decarboxylase family protein n=1 Tax=Actinotalea lenta TaxID=3064654 RepID=UPI002713304C|nr:aminotransferase class V-fold PLP-dependent enzyme [Isoptericola sp. b490]MDO8121900.1 aminotransferase class V-fold PLP-dependent enzyme [Isoptericola sp. b490]